MADLVRDLRLAARSLRRQPGVTIIATACLALGIGANTAIFSVVRTVLLGALPYHEPGRLVRLNETWHAQGLASFLGSVSVPNLLDWRAENRSFEGLAAYDNRNMNLLGDPPERLRVTVVTADMFALLGARPLAGRFFREGEDAVGAPGVVILSEGLWRRRFGARRSMVDSTVVLDGRTYAVIGVMPAAFDLPVGAVRQDAWVPLRLAADPDLNGRGNHWLQVVGRLKSGVSLEAAQADLATIAARLARAYPSNQTGRSVIVRRAAEVTVGGVRAPLLILLGAVGLVLVIACANVANLLLARAAGRDREVAIRAALGAEPRHLVRQLLSESLLLALTGGILGLGVAWVALRGILTLAAATLPRAGAVGLDPLVLAFTLALSVLTGSAFGLVPLRRALRTDVRDGLMGGRASAGVAHHRMLRALVVTEIAVSLVLASGAGLLVRSFLALTRTPSGLEPRRVLTFRARVATAGPWDSTPYRRFYAPVLERLRALPGVRAAGVINLLPLQSWGTNGEFRIIGRPQQADPSREPFAEFRVVSRGYFEALGVGIMAGRAFDARDVAGSAPVAMINQAFARRYFPGEDPVGKRMRAWSRDTCTIIGVAGDVRQSGLDQEPRTEVYVVAAQNAWRLGNMSFVVATRGAPAALVSAVRAAVLAVAPDQPIYAVESMEQVIGDSLRGRKLMLVLLGSLAGLALALAAAGVHGVMAYTVAQRTRELGIRVALGATGRTITRMVLTEAAALAGIGAGIGAAGALALMSLLRSLLYGVAARDPLSLALATAFIAGVALGASVLPAWRAARADPLIAIRAE